MRSVVSNSIYAKKDRNAPLPQCQPSCLDVWRVFSVKIRTLIHNFDEVGQKLYEVGQLVYEVGQLVYEVGQLLDGVSQLLMVADRGIPKRAPDARYPILVGRFLNPVGPLPNHVAKVHWEAHV